MRFFWRIMLGVFTLAVMAGGVEARPVKLTEAERTWLAANPRITFSYDPDFAPFSYRDEEGKFSGLDAEILKELGKRLGVEFVPVHKAGWPEAYRAAEAKEVLMLTSTSADPEREKVFVFTRPYVEFPVAIFTRQGGTNFDELGELAGKRVAAVRDYAPTLRLKREHPTVMVEEYGSVAEALQAVAAGKADATLTNLVNASYAMRKTGITGLKVAGVVPYSFELRFAVHASEPELRRVLDEAVASLDATERQALLAPWVKLEAGAIVSWHAAVRWFIGGCFAAVVVLAVVGWHNRSLRRELEERMRLQKELERSHARLEKLNEEKAGLMRMAAHDLRNPLSGLLLSVDLLRVGDAVQRAETTERMVVLIHQMLHMVRNLLDVQALEAGTRKVRLERVAVRAALEESLATFQPAAGRKQIRLTGGETDPVVAVKADRSAYRQVCDNLISNAVKYSPIGGRVEVTATRAGNGKVRMAVRDEGPGVRPEEMGRLFEKYTCLSTRPTGGEASTGLGLSIVKELVQRMGGRVWCESVPGKGATFWVELPEAGPGER